MVIKERVVNKVVGDLNISVWLIQFQNLLLLLLLLETVLEIMLNNMSQREWLNCY